MNLHYSFPWGQGSYDSEYDEYYCDNIDYEYEITEDQTYEALKRIMKEDHPQMTDEEIDKELDDIDLDDYRDILNEEFEDDAYNNFKN